MITRMITLKMPVKNPTMKRLWILLKILFLNPVLFAPLLVQIIVLSVQVMPLLVDLMPCLLLICEEVIGQLLHTLTRRTNKERWDFILKHRILSPHFMISNLK